jgi:multidrug efflux system membrane fusion protein
MTASEFHPSVRREVQPRTLSPRLKWALVLVGGIVLIGLGWHLVSGWLHGKTRTPPPPPVTVARAHTQTVTVTEHTIATVVSPATVQANAQVAGKLLKAYFQEGQIVHKGDVLFLIDPAPFQNSLAQARAQLAKDQAQAISLTNDEQRYVALYAANATSQQSRDQAVAAAQSAQATVQADQAAVAIAEENLGYTKIVSPIDGKTGPIVVQPGNLVTVAGTSLVTITQIQPIKLSFFLPQSELAQIQDQMAAGKLMVSVPMPGAAGGAEKAAVDFVSNVVSATTGTIELRATFPNTDMRLVPGQTVNVSVSLRDIADAVVVPRDAVNPGPDGSYVDVVGKDMKVSSVPVSVLNDDGTSDAIKGNVKSGDTVITDGQLRVVPGNVVAIGGGRRGGARKAGGT